VIDAHQQRRSSLLGKIGEGAVEDAVRFRREEQRLRAGSPVDLHWLVDWRGRQCVAPLAAQVLERDHPCDAEQPSLQLARLLDSRQPLMRAHERLLRSFIRSRVVAEQIAQEPPHPRSLPIEDHAKCLRIARTRARQQLLIGMPVAGAGHLAL